jgi:hypothetical protein
VTNYKVDWLAAGSGVFFIGLQWQIWQSIGSKGEGRKKSLSQSLPINKKQEKFAKFTAVIFLQQSLFASTR